MLNSSSTQQTDRSHEYELPLYRSPPLPLLPPVPLGPQGPGSAPLESLQPLFPVHLIILRHLADLEPTKALTLSRYCYDSVLPYIYRYAKASKSLLRGLELKKGYERKLKALKYVETLSLEDKTGVWHIAMLGQPGNVPRVYEGVFAGVRVLETSREMREGFYGVEETPASTARLFSYKEMLRWIEPQLRDGWVEKETEGVWLGGISMRCFWEYRPRGAEVLLNWRWPWQWQWDWWYKWWQGTAAAVLTGACIIVTPSFFFLMVSLATNPIHSLAIATLTTDWVAESRPDGNITVPVKINVGVANGCIWYNQTGPSCSWALPWRPDPALLHLPANQTLTECFPTANGRALILAHVFAAASVISVVYTFKDFRIASTGKTIISKRAYVFIAVLSLVTLIVFPIVIAYADTLRTNMENGAGMGYNHQMGPAVWLSLSGLMAQFLAMMYYLTTFV